MRRHLRPSDDQWQPPRRSSIGRTVGLLVLLPVLALTSPMTAEVPPYQAEIDRRAAEVEEQVITWRRDIHQHPELGNREVRTSGVVAAHLKSLGLDEVRTGIAHTGVVGVLRGGQPGPVVALRADMDALPVKELVDIPFASQVTTEYNGRQVGVMHACGHDVHTAVLMGTASVLAGMRDQLPGTVVFVFQPAEEGPPAGENGGAKMMIEEGVLNDPAPDAIFALHTMPAPSGFLAYRPGGTMAGSDGLKIEITGSQTHGAVPWGGVDPIVVASQVILGLQTITSRQIDLTAAPAVITIGMIQGGVRGNIIPESVEMEGTIRLLDPAMRDDVLERIERTAKSIAESAGARAEVTIEPYAPVTYNDPELTGRMAPTLERVGPMGAQIVPAVTPSEDFSFFQEKIPGFYFFLGIADPENPLPAPNHSPYFSVHEEAMLTGVRAMSTVAVDYLHGR